MLMDMHNEELRKNMLKLVLQELREDPYYKFKLVFALMGVIPLLAFAYIALRLLPHNGLSFGRISFILYILTVISLLAFFLGYGLIKKLIDKIIFFAIEMKRSEQLKSDLAASISHDFEIPVKILQETVSNITSGAHGQLNEAQAGRLNSCQETLVNMCNTIKTLLDLYKIEAGLESLKREPGDLAKIIDEKIREFGFLFNQKKIQVTKHAQSEPGLAKIDIDKMKEVINNIFSNFIKYTPENGWLKWRICQSRGFVRLELSNNSEPIPAGQIGAIFDKFRKLDYSKEGSGLGLAISKGIMRVHGGDIWAENIPDKGVRFVAVLPADG